MLVLVACVGCRATLRPGLPSISEATTLTLKATPLENGEFELSGTTNLPDKTQLTAIALRYWLPSDARVLSADAPMALGRAEGAIAAKDELLYSVLDYQPVTVTNGEWSAQLKLWQVAADGRYQEPWQAQAEALNLAAQPRQTVQFAITLAPHHLGAAMSDVLAQAGRQRVAGLLRVTAAGEPFLWADQPLPVGLPRGQTTPPADRLARTNGGWGERYLLVPEPPLPYTLTPEDQRQTTAPLTLGEMLQ
jgi:hypothetical protein